MNEELYLSKFNFINTLSFLARNPTTTHHLGWYITRNKINTVIEKLSSGITKQTEKQTYPT